MSDHIVNCKHVAKNYKDARSYVSVLRDINLAVEPGEFIAITGSSGSGKTTLLNLLAGLDLPSSGAIEIAGKDPAKLTEAKRSEWRNFNLGFIYQFHHLLPEFNALENVSLPLLIRGNSFINIQEKAKNLLEAVGLAERLQHRPGELSGGERQRVAVARAMITDPKCILADEPTGNLDAHNAELVLKLFLKLQKQYKTSVLFVTHNISIAEYADRKFILADGCLFPSKKIT